MRNFLKTSLLFFLYILNFFRPPRAAVLMYHSISNSDWLYSVPPEEFERQMRYLRDRCSPVDLGSVIEYIGMKQSLPPRAVAVTFDDGYRDFLTSALPVLEKYKIPATLFLCADEPERRELGNDLPLLTPEEVKSLAKHPLVEIGSHGLTHRKLAKIPLEEAKNEILAPKVILEELVGRPVRFFAYPKGNFNPAIAGLVKEAGHRGAVAAEPIPTRRGGDLFAVGRLDVTGSLSFSEFKIRLTRAGDWYYFIWKLLKKRRLW